MKMYKYEPYRLCFPSVSDRFNRLLRLHLVVASTFLLVACGGGGSGSRSLTDSELEQLEMDPRIAQRTTILERADILLKSSYHLDYTFRGNGRTVQDKVEVSHSCSGSSCRDSLGTVTTIDDFFNNGINTTKISIGGRGGFNTATLEGRLAVPRTEAGFTFTRYPDPKAWGLWGEHGYAAVQVESGQVAGRVDGNFITGEIDAVGAYAMGTATGSNPSGIGSATWRGIAEAASTRTFRRSSGTAIVSIGDLSRPQVDVEINIPGTNVGTWSDIRITNGRYSAGTAGHNRLVGDFHGPGHRETYGVFDTGLYVGAFGAKRSE